MISVVLGGLVVGGPEKIVVWGSGVEDGDERENEIVSVVLIWIDDED